MRPLIPSSENGLFSRQLFYFMPAIDEWADQLGEEEDENDVPDFDSLFEQWGEEWKKQVDELRRTTSRIRLWLSSKQKRRINTTFARLFSHAGATRQGDMKSTVARMAINAMRMMCVVAFLRSAEMPALLAPENHVPKENVTDGTVSSFRLTICDTDFEAVISLATVLYRHACFILSFLPQSEVIKREVSPLERLFDILPLKFTTRQAHEEARKLQIPEGSVKSAIKRMTDQGKLNQTERGTYEFRARVRV